MKFKKGNAVCSATLDYSDNEGAPLAILSFRVAKPKEYRFLLSTDGHVGMSAKQARKLAEAILKELDH